jgi:hypothetical protein
LEICPVLTDKGLIIEKKIVNNSIMEILILTGMLFQLKTGRTRKNAEILVITIATPRSFSFIGDIYTQRPICCIWPNISFAKLIIIWSIQLLQINNTAPTAKSLGTIVKVISRIDVTAWSNVTTKPTTRQVIKTGADNNSAVSSV